MILQQFRWGPGRQAQLLSSVFSEPRSRYRYVTQIALGDGTNCSGEARDLQKCNEDRGFHVMKRDETWKEMMAETEKSRDFSEDEVAKLVEAMDTMRRYWKSICNALLFNMAKAWGYVFCSGQKISQNIEPQHASRFRLTASAVYGMVCEEACTKDCEFMDWEDGAERHVLPVLCCAKISSV